MTLPPLLLGWMDDALAGAVPEEGRAPCGACVQCAATGALPTALATFDPVSKCCTYLPLLRCFQVGFVLADDDETAAEGRTTVEARIDAGVAVTPLGLLWPASFGRAYGEGQEDRFGRRRELRCPHHLDDGRCGVWKHRNATCSTWFCRYERGDVGRTYWRALHALLEAAEDVLMWWCVDVLDVGAQARELLASGDGPHGRLDGDVVVDEAMRRAVWGRWYGRERSFYLEAAERVRGLSWADVLGMGGARLRALVEAVDEAAEDRANVGLPPFVSAGEVREALREGGRVWAHGYRAYDPVDVPEGVWEALRAVDGAATESLSARLGGLDRAGMRDWLDRGMLRPSLPRGG